MIIVALVGVLVSFLPFFSHTLLSKVYGPEFVRNISPYSHIYTIFFVLLRYAVQIVIGIWLFQLAKEEGRPKWLWLILGFFLGLISLVMFYLIKLNEKVDKLQSN